MSAMTLICCDTCDQTLAVPANGYSWARLVAADEHGWETGEPDQCPRCAAAARTADLVS